MGKLHGIVVLSTVLMVAGCGTTAGSGRPAGAVVEPAISLSADPFYSSPQLLDIVGNRGRELLWSVPETIEGWESIPTEPGTMQFLLENRRCMVTLSQPLNPQLPDTTTAVMDEYLDVIVRALNLGNLVTTTAEPLRLPVVDRGVDIDLAGYDWTTDTADGSLFVHTSGHYALIAFSVCSDPDQDQMASAVPDLLRSLGVRIQ